MQRARETREACASIGGSQGNLADLRSVLSWKSPSSDAVQRLRGHGQPQIDRTQE